MPIRKIAEVVIFFLSGICSFQITGSGRNNKIKSIRLFPIPISKTKVLVWTHESDADAMSSAIWL